MGFWKRNLSCVTVKDKQYTIDQRVAATLYCIQNHCVQAEYNIGKGPRYNKLTNVDVSNLEGGYLNYKWICRKISCIHFQQISILWWWKKFEKDARSYTVRDFDQGWVAAFIKHLNLLGNVGYRWQNFEDSALKKQQATRNLLRLQAQSNFLER
jgi:hypothetical protein